MGDLTWFQGYVKSMPNQYKIKFEWCPKMQYQKIQKDSVFNK